MLISCAGCAIPVVKQDRNNYIATGMGAATVEAMILPTRDRHDVAAVLVGGYDAFLVRDRGLQVNGVLGQVVFELCREGALQFNPHAR